MNENERLISTKGIDFEGSDTQKCIHKAFEGESLARNKYTYFSKQAKKDGYVEISEIFEKTAENEKEHAKIWYKLLNNNEIKNTKENLKTSIETEHFEGHSMYPDFAKIAQDEGFEYISNLFKLIIEVEKFHEKRFQKHLDEIENNEVFERKEDVNWQCQNCGYIANSKIAPEICPLCLHKQEYFSEIKEED